jgi:hypothetical protein
MWPRGTRIVSFEASGLILRRGGSRFTVAYGEILTAERVRSIWGLRLHSRSSEPLRIPCRGAARTVIEDELRRRGVRVVDCWGAIISPTLADFQEELDREPVRMRQSSDSA